MNITCPGIKKPRLNNGNFTEEDRKLFKYINTENVAFLHKNDCFRCFGCGAWQCPQVEVANIFLKFKEYNGMFHTIEHFGS